MVKCVHTNELYTYHVTLCIKPIFSRRHNIGQNTFVELSDSDLIQLGVNDEQLRNKLLAEVQNLPIYEEACERM